MEDASMGYSSDCPLPQTVLFKLSKPHSVNKKMATLEKMAEGLLKQQRLLFLEP